MSEAPAAAAPAGLGDFFKAKAKKKIKGSNLNNSAAPKAEAKKRPKDAEEEGWEEEQVVVPNLKVEIAGKLTRDEDKKEDEDSAAPAWGNVKSKADKAEPLNDKKFPTLAKSMIQSSNINIDDGSDPKINIQTSKNAFSALEGAHDSDEDGPKRPKEIKPWQVQKKKGEFEKAALQREVDKYQAKDAKNDKKSKKKGDEDDDDEEDESEEEEEEERPKEVKKKNKKAGDKKADKEEAEETEEKAADLTIQPDLVAAKDKYKGRRKLPKKELPEEELEEEKENKPVAQGKKGKKKAYVDEEALYDSKKKLAYADWD